MSDLDLRIGWLGRMTRDHLKSPQATEEWDGRRAPGWLETEVLATLWAATEPMNHVQARGPVRAGNEPVVGNAVPAR